MRHESCTCFDDRGDMRDARCVHGQAAIRAVAQRHGLGRFESRHRNRSIVPLTYFIAFATLATISLALTLPSTHWSIQFICYSSSAVLALGTWTVSRMRQVLVFSDGLVVVSWFNRVKHAEHWAAFPRPPDSETEVRLFNHYPNVVKSYVLALPSSSLRRLNLSDYSDARQLMLSITSAVNRTRAGPSP